MRNSKNMAGHRSFVEWVGQVARCLHHFERISRIPKVEVASWFEETAAVGRSPQPLPQAIGLIRDPERLDSVLGDLLAQSFFQKPFINVSSFGIRTSKPTST